MNIHHYHKRKHSQSKSLLFKRKEKEKKITTFVFDVSHCQVKFLPLKINSYRSLNFLIGQLFFLQDMQNFLPELKTFLWELRFQQDLIKTPYDYKYDIKYKLVADHEIFCGFNFVKHSHIDNFGPQWNRGNQLFGYVALESLIS